MSLERIRRYGVRRPLVAGGVALVVLESGGVAVAASLVTTPDPDPTGPR